MMTFPEINNAREMRDAIRSIYWLNNRKAAAREAGSTYEDRDDDDDVKKENGRRATRAFEAIRYFNMLSSTELDVRRAKRRVSSMVRRGDGLP